jgi:5'-nucleotidase (lipoprotein e(P4) family)
MSRRTAIARAMLLTICTAAAGCASHTAPALAVSNATKPARDGVAARETRGVRETHENLNGVLWMQTAAEYWALASTAYRRATIALDEAINDKTWTAAIEQTGGYDTLPHAVILDLDETVLDNSPLQAQLVLEESPFVAPTWDAWVGKMNAGLIPGAKDFIAAAELKGVKVFYVTNRSVAEQGKTLKNLVDAGIAATDETVLCTGENSWTSDKSARRAEIARTHRILMLVGDDMNDFVSIATLTPAERLALAMQHTRRWGSSWILLPNPLYGSWERALYADAKTDEEVLRKKREAVKGFR